MKIDSWKVSMSGSHSYLKSYTKEESLRYWSGERGQQELSGPSGRTLPEFLVFELSDQARAQLVVENGQAIKAESAEQVGEFELSDKDKLKIQLVEQMMQSLTGKKFKFYIMDKVKFKKVGEQSEVNLKQGETVQPQRQGWGFEYNLRESYFEQEKMSFKSHGVIKTSDGREINFSVQMNMSREFAMHNHINIRAGDAAIDPLVINFNGKAAELTETKFSFDLDADGIQDQISFVKPGSGFLALDLDGDGKVTDGRELFGPSTGNGFSELSAYDEDGNQWIDENDAIYDKLRIWTKDEKGNDVLMALGQAGVGAIFLGNINTPFDMKDGGNNLLGQVRQSGIYLNENGTVGTVQQIDLVV